MTFATKIINLKTNYACEPLGIEGDAVHFSWEMQSERVGAHQQGYHLFVLDNQKVVWDSGVVASSNSIAVSCPLQFAYRTAYEWYVKVQDERGVWGVSAQARFETGVTGDAAWLSAPFICLQEETEVAPVFIFESQLSQEIISARLYVTALGVYQFAVNGRLDETPGEAPFLNPGYGNGEVSLAYQTYDITPYLAEADHLHVAVTTGNGWSEGMGTTRGTPSIKAMLVLTSATGDMVYLTDPETWQASLAGAVRKNGIYYGEDYDANFLNVTEFYGVTQSSLPLGTRTYPGKITSRPGLYGKLLLDQAFSAISGMIYQSEEVRSDAQAGDITILNDWVTSHSEALSSNQGKEGAESIFEKPIQLQPGATFLIDFGQNVTAVPAISVRAAKDTQITLRFSEMLNDGHSWDQEKDSIKGDGPKGTPYFKNLRQARASVVLTTSSNEIDDYRPALSFFGYRYMTVEVDQPTEILGASSIPLSSVSDQVGYLETNNHLVNKLVANVRYGQLSNYFTTATDCPQRDERLFWSGDTQVFAQSALYNYDSVAFLTDLQKNMAENTLIKGYTPMVVDSVKDEFFSAFSAGWSDALVINAWTLFVHTGDVASLAANYPAFLRYVAFLEEHERMPDAAPLFGEKNCGDWLSFQGTNVAMMGDYYYAYTILLLEKISLQLGKASEARVFQQKFAAIKQVFYQNHLADKADFVLKSGDLKDEKYQFFGQGEGKKGGVWEDNSQTALLWFLKLEFSRDADMAQEVKQLLLENIRNQQPKAGSIREKQGENTLAIGFLGVNVIAPILTRIGAADLAYDLVLQTEAPSWLFSVEAGATTVWERWNSYDPQHGFGDSEMNSFNHYAYGAIVEWLYHYTLGIMVDVTAPGFRQLVLQPTPDKGIAYNQQGRITQVKGSYQSPYGLVDVAWRSEAGALVAYSVTLPANTTALLYLPVEAAQSFEQLPVELGSEKVRHNGQDCLKLLLVAGHWEFSLSKTGVQVTIT